MAVLVPHSMPAISHLRARDARGSKCCLRMPETLSVCLACAARRELQPYDEPTCRAAIYDYSGQYLAVGGSDLRVYAPKQVRGHDHKVQDQFCVSLLLHLTGFQLS